MPESFTVARSYRPLSNPVGCLAGLTLTCVNARMLDYNPHHHNPVPNALTPTNMSAYHELCSTGGTTV